MFPYVISYMFLKYFPDMPWYFPYDFAMYVCEIPGVQAI